MGPSGDQAGIKWRAQVWASMDPVPYEASSQSVSLLVRRVPSEALTPSDVDNIGAGRATPGFGPVAKWDLDRHAATGGLFVLTDLAGEPSSVPMAVAVFEKVENDHRARLVFLSIDGPDRQPEMIRRLLEGALMLLRSDGIELVEAGGGEALRQLLENHGFQASHEGKLLYWL